MASNDGRVLALIPVFAGVLLAALLFPRDAAPSDVPLPNVDERVVAEVEHADDARAARATQTPLPAEVRALGEAVRVFNTTEAKNPTNAPWPEIRASVDNARRLALAKGVDAIVDLRAVQLRRFLDELGGWRKAGKSTDELEAEGGSFLRRMTMAGWVKDNRLLLSDREIRVIFKLKWNAVGRFEQLAELQPTTDEMRVLYSFYLLHPHAGENARETLVAARMNAHSPEACAALVAGEQIATEQWRLDKIDKLAQIDPSYPAAYARGVSLFRAAKFEASVHAFEEWLRAHPDGPLTLRARNHLRAALAQAR
jgi:hypothetical protein